ncbi:unnamed protein product [Phytophthora fragariaefolia]|uniref:Unnamed protein product n=1 Tax=Phytophthora fragariaefolia TaxID=1490495 RepID=A0A9W6XDE8_9STRA|nr:unnamed protein product [Phytophthora fragariaefolia]
MEDPATLKFRVTTSPQWHDWRRLEPFAGCGVVVTAEFDGVTEANGSDVSALRLPSMSTAGLVSAREPSASTDNAEGMLWWWFDRSA